VEEGRINHNPAIDGNLKGAAILSYEEGITPALIIMCSYQKNKRLTALDEVNRKLIFI
jgi:hypothetical protein